MSEKPNYERKVSPLERLFSRSPYSIVTVVARIKGDVSESLVRNAVSKVQQRHTNLRVRIKEDSDHVPWFTSEGVEEIPVDVVPRESDDHWIQVHQEASQIPFEFDVRPAMRFILVQSPTTSELIILCHHIICDGLSLAYLARDLMVHLGDPAREVEVLPDPLPIGLDNLPEDVSLNPIVGFFINRINKKWERDKVIFDQEDYENLNEAYWANFEHKVFSVELSEAQTFALVDRCRKNRVTVNSALTTAFIGAQLIVPGDGSYHPGIGVAANLRNRLQKPVGESMGFYAGIVTPKHKYNEKISFWENAQRVHEKVSPLFTNKNLFSDFISWCYLEPAILEAINFKKLGGLVAPHQSRYQKLSAFGKRDDVVLGLLKRDKRESLDRMIMGTAVTNLGRMDFPREYGALELDRLIMQPGGAFPLVNVNLVLGAVTCAGKLSLVVEYAEQAIDTETMRRVKDRAIEFLLSD
ncbi:MAG: condensation domain-containing protein [Chloroflexota bacterium]|nr:condensation domain-containing protein [Chloroflexota bacterium]